MNTYRFMNNSKIPVFDPYQNHMEAKGVYKEQRGPAYYTPNLNCRVGKKIPESFSLQIFSQGGKLTPQQREQFIGIKRDHKALDKMLSKLHIQTEIDEEELDFRFINKDKKLKDLMKSHFAHEYEKRLVDKSKQYLMMGMNDQDKAMMVQIEAQRADYLKNMLQDSPAAEQARRQRAAITEFFQIPSANIGKYNEPLRDLVRRETMLNTNVALQRPPDVNATVLSQESGSNLIPGVRESPQLFVPPPPSVASTENSNPVSATEAIMARNPVLIDALRDQARETSMADNAGIYSLVENFGPHQVLSTPSVIRVQEVLRLHAENDTDVDELNDEQRIDLTSILQDAADETNIDASEILKGVGEEVSMTPDQIERYANELYPEDIFEGLDELPDSRYGSLPGLGGVYNDAIEPALEGSGIHPMRDGYDLAVDNDELTIREMANKISYGNDPNTASLKDPITGNRIPKFLGNRRERGYTNRVQGLIEGGYLNEDSTFSDLGRETIARRILAKQNESAASASRGVTTAISTLAGAMERAEASLNRTRLREAESPSNEEMLRLRAGLAPSSHSRQGPFITPESVEQSQWF